MNVWLVALVVLAVVALGAVTAVVAVRRHRRRTRTGMMAAVLEAASRAEGERYGTVQQVRLASTAELRTELEDWDDRATNVGEVATFAGMPIIVDPSVPRGTIVIVQRGLPPVAFTLEELRRER